MYLLKQPNDQSAKYFNHSVVTRRGSFNGFIPVRMLCLVFYYFINWEKCQKWTLNLR